MDYSVELTCYNVDLMEASKREGIENGGKVLLPASVLEDLVGGPRLPNPLLFTVENPRNHKSTNVGVLEFIAESGTAILPTWVLAHLDLQSGDRTKVSLSRTLPVARFARFQPKSKDFLNISDPKAVLENCLRKFACLTTGDVFHIDYNNRVYSIIVEETKPASAVNIIECDMEVEFSPPEDYVEPEVEPRSFAVSTPSPSFVPFACVGRRLDGKPTNSSLPTPALPPGPLGQPDYNYTSDSITFFRNLQVKNKANRTRIEE